MFADENGDVAVLEPEQETTTPTLPIISAEAGPVTEEEDEKRAPEGTSKWPEFIHEIDNVYRSNRAHVFVLHGNVNDYPDNTGVRGDIGMKLFMRYDRFWLANALSQETRKTGKKVSVKAPTATNIACKFTVPNGLVFATEDSLNAFREVLKSVPPYAGMKDEDLNAICQPKDLPNTLMLLNEYFKASAKRFALNQPLRVKLMDKSLKASEKAQAAAELSQRNEANLTVIWYDTKMCFPNGQVSQLMNDRTPIAYIENWALDGSIAPRNKMILITQRIGDIQESLRSGDSRVQAVRISRPTMDERKEWLAGFTDYIKTTPALINSQARTAVVLAEDINWDIFANGTAGMSRVQMEAIFMQHWLTGDPVDLRMVADHKKKALEAEYGDILDIRQPDPSILCPETKGKSEEVKRAAVWSLLGGLDLLKQFGEDFVIEPMLIGDRRRCTRGFILAGCPGTGKSWYAELLAANCGVNFIFVDFSKLFGGIVGDTERNVQRLFEAIEAMAPCIVFADEIDLAFPKGRQAGGDSGVGIRMLGSVMKWLSADARWGKVIVLAATNRPDGLDEAFMRAGRFDDILPVLPPHPTDTKGRKSLLGAVCKKSNVRVHKSLAETMKSKDSGLGRLLLDSRIWTGAEMERLVKLAFSNAARRVSGDARKQARDKGLNRRETLEFLRNETKNPLIELGDWDRAMNAYKPKTRAVEEQIDLALGYCNNSEYCPPEWVPRFEEMQNPDRLKSAVDSMQGYSVAAAAYDRE
jgi:SpoVK/Ycf46/Vps4 family AAA+-type ATPase